MTENKAKKSSIRKFGAHSTVTYAGACCYFPWLFHYAPLGVKFLRGSVLRLWWVKLRTLP